MLVDSTADALQRSTAASRLRSRPQVVDPSASAIPVASYVTIAFFASLTGYSAKAIRRKIESRIWLEGREYRKAPDGHVLVSLKGYQQWVERGRV